jgi:hypothetical protein
MKTTDFTPEELLDGLDSSHKKAPRQTVKFPESDFIPPEVRQMYK